MLMAFAVVVAVVMTMVIALIAAMIVLPIVVIVLMLFVWQFASFDVATEAANVSSYYMPGSGCRAANVGPTQAAR
jgi:hypothetical protein